MKIAAESLFRCFRSTLPSAVLLSALSGGVGELFDLSQAVAQTGSAYSATPGGPGTPPPNAPGGPGTAPTSNAPGGPGTAPTSNAPGASSANAPTQKSEAAQRVEKLCGAKNAGVVGEPLSLEKLLYGVYSPRERYRRLAAYWDLVGKRAYFNLCAECASFANECAAKAQKKYDGGTVPQETAAFLAASRLVAAQRREAARIDFVRTQYAFDAAFSSPAARRAAWERRRYEAQNAAATGAGKAAAQAAVVGTPTSPVLYVPTAFPTVDVYATRFDEIARRRGVSSEAARLNVALPLLYEATQSRAEQARGEWSALNSAFVAAETTETALFAALDRYLAASREMLAAATRYNQAIAAYVAETVPGSLRGAALLKTLNLRPTAAASPSQERANSGATAAPTNVARKPFVDETPIASATFVAPAASVVSADSAIAPTSFVDPAPKPDLTPTPGARLEPAGPPPSAPTKTLPAPPAEPLPTTPEQPATPAQAPTPAADSTDSGASTLVVTGYEQPAAKEPTPSAAESEDKTPPADDAGDEEKTPPAAAFFVGRIVRGQAPETPETASASAQNAAAPTATTQSAQKPQTPPSAAPTQNPQNAQNAQNAQVPAPAANAGARRRVDETVAALFATPKAEPSPNGVAAGPLEVATTLRSVLERVPVSERAATVRAYWRLQEASARVAVETTLAQSLTQAFNELNAKASGSEAARLYLAAARGAQARVAEARIVKRDAQIALTRRARLPLGQGWPIPATLPFAGPTYRLETPPTTSPTLALEGAVIPENLKAIETLGSAFGPPATLCSFDVSPASAADPLVPLATLEKKRESLLLFVELVVATNVSIAEYVASYPAGFVSVDRFVDALVGPGK